MRSLLLKGDSHQGMCRVNVRFISSFPPQLGLRETLSGGNGVDKKQLKAEGVSLTITATHTYRLLPTGPGTALSRFSGACTYGGPTN